MRFDVSFSETNHAFDVSFSEKEMGFTLEFGEIQLVRELESGDKYDGSYSVIPKATPQILHTKQKVMTDDLLIFEIPYAEVTNFTGGMTASIG